MSQSPPPDLVERVTAALPLLLSESCGNPVGAFFEVIEETGGHGLCEDASAELRALLGEGELWWLDLTLGVQLTAVGAVPSDYPREVDGFPAGDHCVLRVGDWFVDVTARQFDPRLPLPFFWRAP